VEVIPLNCIHGKVVTIVGLQVLTRVGLGAEMDLAFFSADQEEVVLELVEVEAHASCQSIEEGFFLVLYQLLVLVDNELELDDLFRLKLVLHQRPVCYPSIRRYRVETERLGGVLAAPVHLPDGVGVLCRAHR